MPEHNNIPEDIQAILDAQAADKTVSSEDLRKYLNWEKKLSDDNRESIKTDNPDVFGLMGDLMSAIADDPKYENARKTIRTSKALSEAFRVASDFVGLGVSIDQIKESKRELKRIREPRPPGTISKSPQLRAALDRSFRDLASPIGDLAPVYLNNLDNFRQDIAIAKTASSGQAGAFGSLAQSAVNRRRRANIEAIPAINQIRRQQQESQNRLLGVDLAERNLIQNQSFKNFQSNLGQFNRRQTAAGQLGAVGRQNLLQSIQNLGQSLPGTLAPIVTELGNIDFSRRGLSLNPFTSNINAKRLDTTKTTGFDENDLDGYSELINNNMFQRAGTYDPFQQF